MIYDILRRVKNEVNIMMWLTIILALVIVSGVYTYARYTYHTEVTGVTVTVPGIGYCAYNGMTLADCVLVTDADEPYETVSAAKTAIEAKIEVTSFSEVATTDEGLYDAEDDYGTSYYFRGAVEDNYVEYAGYIWRIIRVNGDGSVRMIYDGTTAHANGESDTDRYIGTSYFNENTGDNTYIGYMKGTAGASTYAETHSNKNDSDVKAYIDSWYEENIKDKSDTDGNLYSNYLSDTLFCNDRSLYTGTGIGTISSRYSGFERITSTVSPTLTCANQNDRFTVSDTTTGNGNLTYPIALITADEVSMAGGLYVTKNYNYYLYSGSGDFWTMTPCDAVITDYGTRVWYINSSGMLNASWEINAYKFYVKPVINLSSDVYVYSGTGTQDDPYQVSLTRRVDSGCDGELSCVMLLNSTEKDTVSSAIKLIEAKGEPDFSTTATTDEGLYATTDWDGSSLTYYYRGAVTDNYVYFAGYYWRIIRRNGDGSVRLIYDGTEAHANGDSSDDQQIGTSAFNEKNEDITYAGYLYGENFVYREATDTVSFTNFTNSTSYYFSNEFTCDDDSNTCSLTGTLYKGTLASNYSSILSTYYYTCFSTSSTGTCMQIKKISSYTSGSTSVTVKYMGYFSKNYDSITTDENESLVKQVVDNWYKENILNKSDDDNNSYSKYVADTIFCEDRYLEYNTWSSYLTQSTTTHFNSWYRVGWTISDGTSIGPSLTCTYEADQMSVSKDNGNGKLTYPVGLIQLDEVSYAGSVSSVSNSSYYLYTGQSYWTMTPVAYIASLGRTYVGNVASSGFLANYYVTYAYGVRPVINISSDILVASGTGTSSDPYTLKLNND